MTEYQNMEPEVWALVQAMRRNIPALASLLTDEERAILRKRMGNKRRFK